ncbi:ATP-grasp peptide maturase system methyltransferase [Streptomyces cyanogenus]|uniref:Protein-L-isoaspartate O-methyltransferase n=1 Tax=Streptomyces cyanogenus TaxID=80860 RepID=A0ABX7TIA2_STRCY|nr:ATP-grasp peptide maturase system methyltransferase [Streptomyces cyanogenus]QTD96221.1 Protein-L-isoaspartate O-methyltransferase [Streptomyces cyanogenus]
MSDLDTAALRRTLADQLADAGHLHTPPWRTAVQEVPRHEFLRAGFFERVTSPGPTAWRPVQAESPGWLVRCYDDESFVTQVAGTIAPADVRGEILREPTSSSTLPSLVVRMLEDLQVEDGHRVLEIGTGTGYSTGLLCHRLGDSLVTSVEVDPQVSARAATSLGACGYFPDLVVGDGLAGHKDSAPYDRVIATCSVLDVPYTWVEQTRPGGIILATVTGWMHASSLARLTVGEDGTARGRFLEGGVSFMLARPQLPPPLGMLPDLDAGEERPARLAPSVLDDPTALYVAQLAAPRAQRLTLPGPAGTHHILLDVDASAWAALRQDGERWVVRQGGPGRLWDDVEEHLLRWQADDAPSLEQFEIEVSPEGQRVDWVRA